jgi:hypothetical protein
LIILMLGKKMDWILAFCAYESIPTWSAGIK